MCQARPLSDRSCTLQWGATSTAEYERIEPDEGGVIESAAFPGLRLHIPKMLAGDLAGVLAELRSPPNG